MKISWTLGKKLTACFGGLILLLLGIGVQSYRTVLDISARLDYVGDQAAERSSLAKEMYETLTAMVAIERGMQIRAVLDDMAGVDLYVREYETAQAHFRSSMEKIEPLLETAEGKQMLTGIDRGFADVLQAHARILAMIHARQANEAMAAFRDETLPVYKRTQAALTTMEERQNSLMKQAMAEADASISRGKLGSGVLFGFALLLAGIVLMVITQSTKALREIASVVSQGAEQVAAAASQVSSASQSLAQGSSEQAASLEETSASTAEINSMASRNSEHSAQVATIATSSQDKVATAGEALDQMVTAMHEADAASDKIARIIKVIDEIAFQTNILSLNAAVEAARAGEAGLGFAVVADEVRNLAQRSAQAAKDTADLIQDSIARSKDGRSRVAEVAEAVRAVAVESARIKALIDEVHVGSREQARGLDGIGRAVTEMEDVTQRTAAVAEQTASAAEEMTAQSESMTTMVRRLAAMVGEGA